MPLLFLCAENHVLDVWFKRSLSDKGKREEQKFLHFAKVSG